MTWWQAGLLLAGEGCPCCEGESPHPAPGPLEELAGQEVPHTGKWERPEPETIWQCDGCEVRIVIEPDYGDFTWAGGKAVHYQGGYAYVYGEHPSHAAPTREPIHTIGGSNYCSGCAEHCPDCYDVSIFSRSDLMTDSYDEGASFLVDEDTYDCRGVCSGCYEERCAEEAEE